jgi:voltage-gated potassium channel
MASEPVQDRRRRATWRREMYRVIFEADSPGGRLFDVALLWAIVLSVIAVMLDRWQTCAT